MSERRACRVIDVDRKSVRYRSTRDDDADLREKLRGLANQRRRFGYSRLHILLRREGVMINRKKTQRLYKEEGLAVRRRRSRKRAVGTRAPAPVLALALANQRWSLELGASALLRFATTPCMTRWPLAGGSGSSTWSMT